jgi:hypothetical protein
VLAHVSRRPPPVGDLCLVRPHDALLVKAAFVLLLLVLSAPFCPAADKSDTDFLGLAQDARKLSDIGSDSELWVVTLTRAPELRSSALPSTLSLVYLVRKPNDPKRGGYWPDGTELKIQLTRRPDGSYETVYYHDDRFPPKMY